MFVSIKKMQQIKYSMNRVECSSPMADDGFSSEEELRHQQIIVEERKTDRQECNYKEEEVRFIVPPPQEIKEKQYSLKPDIATGWAHKIQLPVPIPIMFENRRFDSLIRRMLKQSNPKAKIVYLGPRYENTFYAWFDKPFFFPYDHIKAPKEMRFTNLPFCGQHWDAEEGLIFDSFFQSGNLDCVIQVGQFEYDCFMRIDSNTAGHLQWFNFKVRNLKRFVKYKINICNFQKDKTLFARGMRPYIHSLRREQKERVGWEQAGENVRFQKKTLIAAKIYEYELRPSFRLSFQYCSSYEEDEIQVAYCIPYTYKRLQDFLAKQTDRNAQKAFMRVGKLTQSLGGLDIPLLTVHQQIGQNNKNDKDWQESLSGKKCVVISGRAHPGESNGSHMMEGFIEFLCGESNMACYLRKYIVFKIVPMLNPDGVSLGNYRTGLSGRDFNRQFKNPDKSIFPEVFAMKKLVADCKALFKDNLLMFLDFHGHSTKKNTFMYGPQFPIIDRYYYQSRLFPKILGNHTSMFRYYSCIFKINQFKETTARAIVLRRLNIPLTYTIQASNGSYFDYQKLKDIPFNECLWKNMGLKIGNALQEYTEMVITAEQTRIQKMENKKRSKEISTKKASKKSTKKQQEDVKPLVYQNQKIRWLVEEIKQAEDKKPLEKVSDDEMSEGSSDREDQMNDLSPQKTNYLFKLIKNKNFKSLSRCRPKRKETDDNQDQPEKANSEVEAPIEQKKQYEAEVQDSGLNSHQIFRKKNQFNARKILSSKEKPSCQQIDKKAIGAKIINFSFLGQAPRRASYDARKIFEFNKPYVPSKINFLDMVVGKWSDEQNKSKRETQSRIVVDLSETQYRRTYANHWKNEDLKPDVKEPSKIDPSVNQLNKTGTNLNPTRKGKFQNYKYRRLLLNSQYESKLRE